MGKLSIRVHKCRILRGADRIDINPRVVILVDNTYRFQTRMKRRTFEPEFEETFVVGNTHRRAVIEVSVYDSESSSLIPGLGAVVGAGLGHIIGSSESGARNPSAQHAGSGNQAGSSGANGGSSGPPIDNTLLGRCYISIERLVRGKSKTRTYVLGSVPRDFEGPGLHYPEGVAGNISITLHSDALGEPKQAMTLDAKIERTYTERLERLLLRYDKARLQIIDLMIAHVRAPNEVTEGDNNAAGDTNTNNRTALPSTSPSERSVEELVTVTVGADSSKGIPGISFKRPRVEETFPQLMARFCKQYNCAEPASFRVVVRVDGCSTVDRRAFNSSVIGSDNVYAILRTESEDFVTSTTGLSDTLVWEDSNEATLDVVNPSSFVMHLVVMGRSSGNHYEIGRTTLSVAPLALDNESSRNMFLCNFESPLAPMITGMVHLAMKPLNFGLTPLDVVKDVDAYYDRLGKFFMRYDPVQIPHIDNLVHSRIGNLESLIDDLIVEHGREPGSVRLVISVEEIVSLKTDAATELNDRSVHVRLSMGGTTVSTKPAKVYRFAPTTFSDSYCFDVVRETDMICVEVVRSSDPSTVYGRVHFSCLNISRGVPNRRRFYLVGEAGTAQAFLSGVITLNLFSDEVGREYGVDEQLEAMHAGRLRRYSYRRVPDALHRVNLAVATVFDMESFMAQLSDSYGDEDPTYAIYFTVIGCRQLRSRFGGISPYVMVRVGVDAYYTKFVKDTKEPDFFEYCEFFFDRPADTFISLIVMDHSDIGNDTEIGRAVIPLSDCQVGQQYHDFLPLQTMGNPNKNNSRDNGSVGFKYVVVDLNLVDRTRTKLLRRSGRRGSRLLQFMTDSRGNIGLPDEPSAPEKQSRLQLKGGGGGGGWLGKMNFWSRRRNVAINAPSTSISLRNSISARSDCSALSTDGRQSDLASMRSLSEGMKGNLMDECIMSMEEFCGGATQPMNTSTANNSENDLGELLHHSETIACITNPDPPKLAAGQMQLRVRVLYCKDLYNPSRQKPNPYLLLSTMSETHRSRMEFDTVNPHYNEEFVFNVSDPLSDFLYVTVLTDTPFGSKKIGHCVMSLRNVQQGEPHTRWVSMVVDSHMSSAFEQGSVCLSLMGVHFGLDYLPSAEAENRLRERVRDFLVAVGPQHLHRLEWFVGEYSLKESALPRLFGKGYVSQEIASSAEVEITIGTVSKLCFEENRVEGNCGVKVKFNGRTRAKTRAVVGTNGYFQFDQVLTVSVDNPTTTPIRLGVTVNGKEKAGVCYLSLADLHRGVPQERAHILVVDPKSSNPTPVGLITVSLMSKNFGSSSAPPTLEEEARFLRLQRYFYYYLRKELAVSDIKYSTTLNVNAYIRQLVDKHGPEPGDYNLRFTINSCSNLNLYATGPVNPFFIIRCGLEEYRTSIVHGKSECVFYESFDLHIGLPGVEKVELILMNFSPAKSVEIGRTHVALNTVKRNTVNPVRLPLVNHGSTRSAGVSGNVDVDLYTEDFGLGNLRTFSNTMFPLGRSGEATGCFSREYSYALDSGSSPQPAPLQVSNLANASSEAADDPQQRRAVESDDGASLQGGNQDTESQHGDMVTTPAPVKITITGLSLSNNFPDEKEVYLRVTSGSKTLLETKSIGLQDLSSMRATFEARDVATSGPDLIFTLKIAVHGILGTSNSLCYADFCLNRCAPSRKTEKRIRLYDRRSTFLGTCQMDVDVPRGTFTGCTSAPLTTRVSELLMDDLASLVAKYSPKELRRIDIALRAGDAKRIHRALRTQLAPEVICTVYVVVQKIETTETIRHELCVSAAVGSDYAETPKKPPGRTLFPYGMSRVETSSGDFCPLRVDITQPGPSGVPLTISVLDRASKSKASELGRAVVSLRALMTAAMFDVADEITVPLVKVRRGANKAHASLIGSVTFCVVPAAYEPCPPSLRFPKTVSANFNRDYIRYYRWRIHNLMKHYDANFLVDLHFKVYEMFVGNQTWEQGLPRLLNELVSRWGPELDEVKPVPALKAAPPPPPGV